MKRGVAVGLQAILGLAGTFFLVVAFRETSQRSGDIRLPDWPDVTLAGLLVILGLIAAGKGWTALLGRGRSRALDRGFYLSQLGKYIPGGLWQPAGQLGLAAGAGVPLGRASAALPVHVFIQIAAGGTVGSGAGLLATHLPPGLRLAPLLSLLPLVLLRRSWMVRVLDLLRRWVRGIPSGDIVPQQSAIARSYAWSLGTFLGAGGGLVILAASLDAADPAALGLPAFALGWVIGFLALPVPAGIGIREAILVSLMASPTGAASVIAASVIHRLLTMGGEVLMILWNVRLRADPENTARLRDDTS